MNRTAVRVLTALVLFLVTPAPHWVWAANTNTATEASAAEPAARQLSAAIDQLNGVVCNFTQQISDARGQALENSAGQMWLSKPQFRWEVAPPFAQIIVADATKVLIYDPDLEQVTERSLEADAGLSPLTLLTAVNQDFLSQFSVQAYAAEQSKTIYELRPKLQHESEGLFARVYLTFTQGLLTEMEIIDFLDQRTHIVFSEIEVDQVLQSDLFQLELPPNVDIVRG